MTPSLGQRKRRAQSTILNVQPCSAGYEGTAYFGKPARRGIMQRRAARNVRLVGVRPALDQLLDALRPVGHGGRVQRRHA